MEKLSPSEKISQALNEKMPGLKVVPISISDVPAEAMEYFKGKCECFRPEGSYSPEDFIEVYKVIRDDGSYQTFIAKEIKEIADYGVEECTYFADVNENNELIGTSELRYRIGSDSDYFKDKPFLGNIRNEEKFMRQGFGTKRMFLMDAYSRAIYSNPLWSDTLNSEEMVAVWEKLVSEGKAVKSQHLEDGENVRYTMI